MAGDAREFWLGLLGGLFGLLLGLFATALGIAFALTGWSFFGIGSTYYAIGGLILGLVFLFAAVLVRKTRSANAQPGVQ